MKNVTLHLLNDTFNHHLDVENAIMEVVKLDWEDAIAATTIAHMNGSYPVFEGSQEEAEKIKLKFEELGINTQITEVDGEPF